MAQWLLGEAAAQDLEELTEFLLRDRPLEAAQTVDLVVDALAIMEYHPRIGRPVTHGLR